MQNIRACPKIAARRGEAPEPETGASGAATIAKVARLANVSETTVSLTFRENSRISPATRRRVREVASRLRYVPNQYARSLRAGRTRLIGLLVNDLANPFYTRLAEVVEEMVESRGYHLLVFNSRWTAEREVAAVRRMMEVRVEGVLACYSERTDEARALLEENGVPHVALDTQPAGMEGAHVLFDLFHAARLAAAHLAELGCLRPALFMPFGPEAATFSSFECMERGFREAWSRRRPDGRPPLPWPAELTIASGKEAFLRLYRNAPFVDAVFCGNDLCAFGVIDAADQLGLAVGERLAVIGIDDLPAAALGRLGLTTLREPVERLATLATTALLDGVENRSEIAIRQMLAPELVQRASTLRFQRASAGGPVGR